MTESIQPYSKGVNRKNKLRKNIRLNSLRGAWHLGAVFVCIKKIIKIHKNDENVANF